MPHTNYYEAEYVVHSISSLQYLGGFHGWFTTRGGLDLAFLVIVTFLERS